MSALPPLLSQTHAQRARAPVIALAVIVTLAACTGRTDAEQGNDKHVASANARATTSSDSGMAGMSMSSGGAEKTTSEKAGKSEKPEGAAANEVTFNAAQLAHGGVRWSPVTMRPSSATATLPGQLVPNEDRTARLGAPARGRIMAVRVQPGDRVARGQVLVTMQSAEAGMAQADVSKAEADLASKKAQATYATSARDRAERLLALKAIPRQDYERAIADDELARASLAQAEAEVRRARGTATTLDANTAASANGEIAVRAPRGGVVLARTAIPGTVVEAGAPLVVVTDPTSLWLTIAAPETMAGLFTRGGRLRFTVPAFPTDTFPARIDAVGAGLDPDTRTLAVRAVTGDAKGTLKSAMLASVSVTGARSVAAALVPEDAVQLVAGVPTVFVVEPDGKGGARFTKRAVEVGARGGGSVAVVTGVRAGELVVTQGAFAVKAELQKGAMPKMEM